MKAATGADLGHKMTKTEKTWDYKSGENRLMNGIEKGKIRENWPYG
ncbi:MAG: hypothetical protein J0H74_00195 [Chitinophagaceae bacterium]|nr:hypothetical protein [Chitinophagaceae bacterium]